MNVTVEAAYYFVTILAAGVIAYLAVKWWSDWRFVIRERRARKRRENGAIIWRENVRSEKV
jgi:threonine/homoserine/homoserine lactone efflux protein